MDAPAWAAVAQDHVIYKQNLQLSNIDKALCLITPENTWVYLLFVLHLIEIWTHELYAVAKISERIRDI